MTDLIQINRVDETPDATRSLVLIKAKDSGFKLLEDVVRLDGKKVEGETAIPQGRYKLGLRPSPKFSTSFFTKDDAHLIERKVWESLPKMERDLYHPHDLIWVMDVPNYEYILHHWGNTCADTRGCGLVGSAFGKLGVNTAVLASRAAYMKYYAIVAPLIRQGGQYITYQNTFLQQQPRLTA